MFTSAVSPWQRRFAALLAIVLAFSVISVRPASAASTILDQYIEVVSVTVNSSGTIAVTYKVKQTIPSYLDIKLGWYYPTAYRNTTRQNGTTITGSPRTSTYSMAVGKRTMAARVEFSLLAGGGGGTFSETKTYYRAVAPPTSTDTHIVTASEAAANVVAPRLASVLAWFYPGSKLLKVAGAVSLGWSLFDGITANVIEPSNCPPLQTGQSHRWDSSWVLNGNTLSQRVQHRVWPTDAARLSGTAPMCNTTYTAISFS